MPQVLGATEVKEGGGWPGWEQGRRKPLVFTEIKGFQVASWAVISHTLPGFVHQEAREK